jgi:two-component system cell cycle sensor histidine kinase/response regulator CckA
MKIRLIHVEDSPADAELVARELRRGGVDADILRCDDAPGLSAQLDQGAPDAVLCDFRMPSFEAPAALALVRARYPNVPFLVVSGTIGEERAVELLKTGVTDYILKDRPARLVPCLRRALAEGEERAARMRAEEELRGSREQFLQSQKMEAVGRLAGGVAHDFNNILTTISGYSELVLMSLEADSPLRAEMQEVLAASERAAKLTRQLLAFSRRQVFELRVLDLNEVVRGVESMLRRLIGENIRVQLALADGVRRVRADAGQIEQVLMNLAVNARDAMPNGGIISIATRAAAGSTELVFADDGEGMTPEVRARAFEPFFTTNEQGKGTGLGLATVYGIVQQTGGSVELETSPGRGARFSIKLPATDEPAEVRRPKPAAGPAGPAPRERVLIVEDDASLRGVAVRILRGRGYETLTAESPAAALRLLEGAPAPALALLDLVMPGMDGRALAAALRERCPGLRVLFMSGYSEQLEPPRPENGRSFPFLGKPFTADALLAKVRETLDEPA